MAVFMSVLLKWVRVGAYPFNMAHGHRFLQHDPVGHNLGYIKPYSEVTRQDKQGFRNGEWWLLTKFGGKKPNTWGPVLKEIAEVCESKNVQLITEGGPVAVRVIRDECVTINEGKDES